MPTTVWRYWNDSTTTSTTACTSTNDVWGAWCDATATTATTAGGNVWVTWCTNATTATATTVYTGTPHRHVTYQPAPETEAQKAERAARMERYKREESERRQRAEAAAKRAEGLLWEHLTDEQRAEYRRSKSFVVKGCHTKRSYRVRCGGGLVANVHELDDKGDTQRRLCAHISNAYGAPNADHYLAQKLLLEHQEQDFLRVANDHGR